MRTSLFLSSILGVTFLTVHSVSGQGFFKPIPPPDVQALVDDPVNGAVTKEWRPIVNLPAFKLVESSRENAQVDALVLTSTGGGVAWQKLKYDSATKKWKSLISVSPATILLSGNLSANSPIDIAYAATVGFLNNYIMVGAGYDLGTVEGRSRVFGLLSVGINFNN